METPRRRRNMLSSQAGPDPARTIQVLSTDVHCQFQSVAQIPPIHKEGYPFIGAFALASLVLFWIWTPLGWIGTVLTVWCALFFRDPVRVTPVREGVVVSPGRRRKCRWWQPVLPPAELGLGDQAAAAHLGLHERIQLST